MKLPRLPRAAAAVGAAGGFAVGLAVEHTLLQRRRRDDPEAAEPFGDRRGVRPHLHVLDDGATIFVEEAGPATARKGAVFVHGSALRTDEWHYQMPGLGGHRLLFYDLRGHGRSHPKGGSEMTMSRLAADLAEVIARDRLERAVIVGHSIGGMIALQLCRDRPDLVGSTIKALVLLNTTPRTPSETVLGGMAAARLERLTRMPLDYVGRHASKLEGLRRVVAHPSDAVFWGVAFAAFGPGASASQIDFTYRMVSETPTDVLFDLLRAYRTFDMTADLEAVAVPAVVVAGTHDRLTVPAAARELAEGLPRAELVELQGCGHMSMLERHRRVDEVIAGVLDDALGSVERKAGSRS